jgi:hypothetical protein
MSQQQVWYAMTASGNLGPLKPIELKGMAERGDLGPNDLIWTEGWEEWKSAKDTPLAKCFGPKEAAPPVAAIPQAQSALPVIQVNSSQCPAAVPHNDQRMTFIVIGGVLALAVLSVLLGIISVVVLMTPDSDEPRRPSRRNESGESSSAPKSSEEYKRGYEQGAIVKLGLRTDVGIGLRSASDLRGLDGLGPEAVAAKTGIRIELGGGPPGSVERRWWEQGWKDGFKSK